MTCSICASEGHDARRCTLNERLCRHSLDETHRLFLAPPCMTLNCVCKKRCTTCYKIGHQAQTQSFVEDRWRFNDAGSIVRKTPRRGIERQDLACEQTTEKLISS